MRCSCRGSMQREEERRSSVLWSHAGILQRRASSVPGKRLSGLWLSRRCQTGPECVPLDQLAPNAAPPAHERGWKHSQAVERRTAGSCLD